MKYKFFAIFLPLLLILGACQNNDVEETKTNEDELTENIEEEEMSDGDSEEITSEMEEVEFLYDINPETFSVIPLDEESNEKLTLLTFDDAPYGNSLKIADALEEKGISAIFFVNGMYMEDEDGFKVVQDLHERGFEIGNHTHTHLNLSEQPEEVQKEEIIKTNEIIEEATGESPRFFRAPYGVMTDYTKSLLEELEMTWMNWSFGYDWETEYQNPDALTEVTLNSPYLSNGANILMHDREWTAAAVPAISEGLEDLGYTIIDPKLIVNKYDIEE